MDGINARQLEKLANYEMAKKREYERDLLCRTLNHRSNLLQGCRLPRSKGLWWWRKCPYCGSKVKSISVDGGQYYWCVNMECDYEYGGHICGLWTYGWEYLACYRKKDIQRRLQAFIPDA